MYRLNPGQPVHVGILYNLQALSSLNAIGLFLIGGGSWIVLLFYRKYLPSELSALLGCLTPFLCVVFLAGNWLEMRVFLEIGPLLWVAAVVSYCNRVSGRTLTLAPATSR